jgi:hypothetical protein
MLRLWLGIVAGVCLAACAAAQGQRPIQWMSNTQQGVAQAKRTGLPVLFYVSGAGRNDDSDLENAQARAFSDPIVRGIAEERFVPVRLPRSNENRQMLQQIGAPSGIGLYLAVVTPDGKLIGTIPPGQAAEAKVLAGQMTALFRKYRADVFKRELKPVLEDKEAKQADIIKALKVVEKFLIVEADESVAKLLERDGLSKTVTKRVRDTLAELSTPKCVEVLLEAALQDKLAAKALARCTPAAAEALLPTLSLEQPEEKFLVVYEAVTKICKISKTKPRGFWSGPNPRLIAEEIERVKVEVRKAAKRWREKYEAYR